MKKKWIAAALCLTLAVSLFSCAAPSGERGEEALSRARAWVNARVEKDELFTFAYAGKPMAEHIGSWEKNAEWADENTLTLTYQAKEGVKATAVLTVDPEFAAVDWVVNFVNQGGSDAPAVSDIKILNAVLPVKDGKMTTTCGSNAEESDFQSLTVDLGKEKTYAMENVGGRSSSQGWPYFDLCADSAGVMGALGWTGNWSIAFSAEADGTRVSAGMKNTDIALHAGESMRTPSMVLVFFDGDRDAGHNALRSLILKSYTPSRNGEKLTILPTFTNNWGGSGILSHFSCVDQMDGAGIPYEGFWIDAGWYNEEPSESSQDTAWYKECGTWKFNSRADMYPNGLKPLGDALAANGKDLMVWFEPERAMSGTAFLEEHPEYFLPKRDEDAYSLFNLGDPEAVKFLVSYIAGLMRENGITCYRQDFNISPSPTWAHADEVEGAHRTGITEAKYIAGLYDFFDGLYEAVPGLMIDNCAGGGRRLDIEMIRRSVAYWTTDYLTHDSTTADDARNINFNLRWWLPVFAYSASKEGRTNDYQMRCMYANGISVASNISDRNWYLTAMKELYDFRRFTAGDYYILASAGGKETRRQNAAYEFYLPEEGEGRVLIFRPTASETATQVYKLKGLEPDAQYRLLITDNGVEMTATGSELTECGVSVTLDNAKTSLMITMTKQ